MSEAPAAAVRSELERILARPEFSPRESLLGRALEWLGERLGPGSLEGPGRVAFWVFAFLVVALLVFALVRAVRHAVELAARRPAEEGSGRAAVAERVRALRREARAARAAGELRRALRLGLLALVLGLGERGAVRYRDAWTNRELLRRGKPTPEARAALEALVDDLEAKEYGRVPATPDDVARLESLCERFLGPLEGVAA